VREHGQMMATLAMARAMDNGQNEGQESAAASDAGSG
jgi:hypothetical protein